MSDKRTISVSSRLPRGIEVCDQPADLYIRVLEKSGIGLLKPRTKPADIGCKVAKGRYSRVKRGQSGTCRDDAERVLPLQTCGAYRIPADIVTATIFFDELTRHVMGEMTCAKREIEQKRPVRGRGLMVTNVADRVVH